MLDCQGGNEVAEALLFFGVSSAGDANEFLDTCPALSWPTLLVALCESRQAWQHFRNEGAEFCRIVECVQSREKKCSAFIRRVTHHIRERGAQGANCFSVRLLLALSKRFPSCQSDIDSGRFIRGNPLLMWAGLSYFGNDWNRAKYGSCEQDERHEARAVFW